VYALGGVTAERHRRLIRGGAHGTAVLGDLFEASTPAAAAERLLAYLA
jgi:thiamine monophosphate synthase